MSPFGRPATSFPARDPFVTSVVTPEAVLLQFRTAGLGSRMMALALDLMVQVGLLVVMFVVLGFAGGGSATVAVVVATLSVFLVLFGYPALLESLWDGRTLGKRALGLRVVTTEGGPVRFRHAAIRAVFYLLDLWIPPGGLTGLTAALLTRRGQRVGDLAAGTIVVRVRGASDRAAPVTFHPPLGHEHDALHLDVTGLRPRQYQLVRRFLLRVTELSPEARYRLADQLARGVAASIASPVPPGVHPETYLVCVAFAHQRRGALLEPRSGQPPPPAPSDPPPPPVGRPVDLPPPSRGHAGAPRPRLGSAGVPPSQGAPPGAPPPPPTGPPVPGAVIPPPPPGRFPSPR